MKGTRSFKSEPIMLVQTHCNSSYDLASNNKLSYEMDFINKNYTCKSIKK